MSEGSGARRGGDDISLDPAPSLSASLAASYIPEMQLGKQAPRSYIRRKYLDRINIYGEHAGAVICEERSKWPANYFGSIERKPTIPHRSVNDIPVDDCHSLPVRPVPVR